MPKTLKVMKKSAKKRTKRSISKAGRPVGKNKLQTNRNFNFLPHGHLATD